MIKLKRMSEKWGKKSQNDQWGRCKENVQSCGRGRKGEKRNQERGQALDFVLLLHYVMMDQSLREGRERRKNVWRREREGGELGWVYCFFFVANWCDPSEPCDLCSTLPEWPAPRHTQGQLELHCGPPPPLFSPLFFLFFFFLRQ